MRAIAIAAALTLWAPAAWASSVPPVDLKPGQTALELGLLDIGLDHMVGDRLSLGASASLLPQVVAVRGTCWMNGLPDGTCWGLTLGAGSAAFVDDGRSVYDAFSAYLPLPPLGYWVAPGLVGAWHLPLGVALRGSLSPTLYYYADTHNGGYANHVGLILVPSLELAFKADEPAELVFGGNALVSLRGKF